MRALFAALLLLATSSQALCATTSFMAMMCGSKDGTFMANGKPNIYPFEVRIVGTSEAAIAKAKKLASAATVKACKAESREAARCTPAVCVKFRDTIPIDSGSSSGSSSASVPSSEEPSTPSHEATSSGGVYCPGDGQWHPQECNYCPGDGKWHSGSCSYSPGDGGYHSGASTYCPGDGKWHGGACDYCPGDGKWHVGECSYSPGSGGWYGPGDD